MDFRTIIKVVTIGMSLTLASCGKLKTANDSTDLGSTTPGQPPAPATQIYTDTGFLLGNFLGFSGNAYPMPIQFPDGSVGGIDIVNYPAGKYPVVGLSTRFESAGLSCVYNSGDCTGDCLVEVHSFGLMKGSITFDGTKYLVYTGKEATFDITGYSLKSFQPDFTTAAPHASTCSNSAGTITVAKPSTTWTPPAGVTLPITGFSFSFGN